jgi:hypothetical protein
MMVGMVDWMEAGTGICAAGEALGGLGKGGLIAVIVISIIAIVAFAWIFRETGKRDWVILSQPQKSYRMFETPHECDLRLVVATRIAGSLWML